MRIEYLPIYQIKSLASALFRRTRTLCPSNDWRLAHTRQIVTQ